MLVMRCVDVLLAFPSILLALGIVSLLGPSLNNAMIAVGISALPVYVRMARASALAAQAYGAALTDALAASVTQQQKDAKTSDLTDVDAQDKDGSAQPRSPVM